MKTELKRIETTLRKLNQNTPHTSSKRPHRSQVSTVSFDLGNSTNENFKAEEPSLPKLKSVGMSNHNNANNPALARNLLQEIEQIVVSWQTELQQIIRQIQDIYLEGPIVDGWLESPKQSPKTGNVGVSKAQQDHLLDYVDTLTDENVAYQSPRPGYRLCGLDEHGKLWSKPCPSDQVPDVGVAIARYQKLRQLLQRKQERETRLNQLAETLIVIHSTLETEAL